MTSSTISSSSTKPELLAEIERLGALLGSQEETYGNRLVQRLWISDRYEIGKTQAGGLKVSFSGQVSARENDGSRSYGAYKNLVAYNENAAAAKAILEGLDRLVEITAFEKPWSNNSKRSDWVILSIAPVERVAQSEAVLANEPYPAEPTSEEVPF